MLAVIIGGWGLGGEYATEQRYAYLRQQLARYSAACGAGFDVSVVLSTYGPSPAGSIPHIPGWNYSGVLDPSQYVCARSMGGLPLRLAQHPWEPLPQVGTSCVMGHALHVVLRD